MCVVYIVHCVHEGSVLNGMCVVYIIHCTLYILYIIKANFERIIVFLCVVCNLSR